jgi:hypothetical protein
VTQQAPPQVTTAKDGTTGRVLVRSPEGAIESVEPEKASLAIYARGYAPVTDEEAVPFIRQRVAGEVITTTEGLTTGLQRGLLGPLPDLSIRPGSQAAQGLQDVEAGAGGAVLGGEVAGTILPFVGPLKAGRLMTVPGLLEAGGSALTTAARRGAPGLARVALSRAAGVGAEVSGALVLEEARRAHLEARPANFSRVLGGYGLGAMIPAMVLGTGVGVLEGSALTLGQRALKRGAKARDLALNVPVSDADMVNAMAREGGVGMPGLLDRIHATKSGLPPNAVALLNDTGPAGELFRQRMLDAEGARLASAGRAAEGLNVVRDVDDLISYAHTGTQKRELVETMMKDQTSSEMFDLQEIIKNNPGVHGDIAQTIAQQVKSKTEFGKKLMNELGLGKGMDVRTAVLRALENGDEAVLRMVSRPEFDKVASLGGNMRTQKWRDVKQLLHEAPTWRKEGNRLLDDLEEGAELMGLEGKGYVGSQYSKLKDIQGLMQGTRGRLAEADRAGAFIELDLAKRKLAEFAKAGERLGADDAVAAYARQSYEALRQNLENPAYWGERAASYQRDMNSLIQKRIARQDAFHKGFFVDSGRVDPNNSWRNQVEATPDSVMNIIGDITDVNHQGARNYREHIRETKDLIDRRLAEMDGLPPEEIAKLTTAKGVIDDTVKSFDETIGHNMLANYAKKMTGANAGWQANLATRSLLGSVMGGVPGAIGAAYLSNKLNPASSWVARAHLERILRQNEARVERAVQRIIGNDVPRSPLAQVVTRLADEPREVKQEGYQKSIKELYAAAQDPTKAQEVIQKELGALEEHMPGITAQAAQQAVAGMRYAYDHAPAKPLTTLVDGEFISPVSDVELHVWELLSEAAMDPTSILEHAEAGELIPEAIDAAEAVAPEFVAELRMEVVNAISNQSLSYDQVVALSTLFKMPVDMTTDPEYIQTQQLLYAARAQAQAPKSPKSFGETGVHKTDTMSKSDQLASGVPPS